MMTFIKMVWRNLWRNTRRSLLTTSAIFFATLLLVFMLALQKGMYTGMINSAVKIHTGHLQIQREGYLDEMNINLSVDNPEMIYPILNEERRIQAFAPRLNSPTLISSAGNTFGALVIGVDPDREAEVSTLKSIIQEGSYFSSEHDYEALLGKTMAKNLGVTVGDEIIFMGQAADGALAADRFYVRGIYKSGSTDFDRSFVCIDIKEAQELFSMEGRVSEIALILDDSSSIKEVKDFLVKGFRSRGFENYKVLTWSEITPALKQAIALDASSAYILYFILLMVVGFGIMNTFLMSIFERMRELGVMIALGMRPGLMFFMVILESLILSSLGILSGVIVGSGLAYYYEQTGIHIAAFTEMMEFFGLPPGIFPDISLSVAIAATIAVFTITLLIAIYPAVKVLRIKPVEALRYI